MYAERMLVLVADAVGVKIAFLIALDDERIFFALGFQLGFHLFIFGRFDDGL